MTRSTHTSSAEAAALKTYHVSLWPLEGCEVRLRAPSPDAARCIATHVFGGDDITEWFAEEHYWDIEELDWEPMSASFPGALEDGRR